MRLTGALRLGPKYRARTVARAKAREDAKIVALDLRMHAEWLREIRAEALNAPMQMGDSGSFYDTRPDGWVPTVDNAPKPAPGFMARLFRTHILMGF